MSEFTNGVLFLSKYIDEMNQLVSVFDTLQFAQSFAADWRNLHVLPVPSRRKQFDEHTHIRYLLHQINEKWSAFLIEDYVLSFSYATIRQWLYDSSKTLPLMVFDHGEDHGWTYSLLNNGAIVSQVNLNYELDWHLAYDFLEVKYPENAGDPKALFDMVDDVPALYKQLRKSTEYQQAVEEMYKNHHPDKFSVFDISDEQINRLKVEISADKFKESFESMRQQIDTFLESLQLEEVSWMSYRYMKRDQEEGE